MTPAVFNIAVAITVWCAAIVVGIGVPMLALGWIAEKLKVK